MQSKEMLKTAVETAYHITLPVLENMRDAPLAFPTGRGGNHAMWLAGHMTYGTGQVIWEIMRGEKNPLAEWSDLFGEGSQPSDGAAGYPAYEEVLTRFRDIHTEALALLDSLDEEALDQPSQQVPAGREGFFGTYRNCFLALALHLSNHRGQVTVCRRAVGGQPVVV